AWPDVDVFCGQLLVELAGDAAGLRDLLRLQPAALQHVQEVGVAADIQLAGALHAHAAILEQAGQHAVDDRRTDLALDVISDDRQTVLLEAPSPRRLTGDEDRDAIDDAAAGSQRLLHVPARGLLAADRQVVDHDV